jgi:hypothetical protein
MYFMHRYNKFPNAHCIFEFKKDEPWYFHGDEEWKNLRESHFLFVATERESTHQERADIVYNPVRCNSEIGTPAAYSESLGFGYRPKFLVSPVLTSTCWYSSLP